VGTIVIRQVNAKMMTGTDSTGHSIVIGKDPEDGDRFVGVKPSDLLLMAAAACSAFDIVEILSKQREPLQDIRILCEGEQQSDPPYTFTRIHLRYFIYGDVDEKKLQRAIKLSEEKYCSVMETLRPGVPISSEYELC
jgi:putative redox protein